MFVLLKGIIEYWGICNELWQQLASGFFLATLFSKTFHTLDRDIPQMFIQSGPNYSNETDAFMCLGRAGRFKQP